MTGTVTVRPLDVMAEATWTWNSDRPTWKGLRTGSATFDPFPAYPHDIDVVRATADQVTGIVPARWDITVVVADREEVGRSNGHSNINPACKCPDDDCDRTTEGMIMLSGKRVPPHPAMTRYLVGHEYGHHVEYMLLDHGGHGVWGDTLVADYAKLRGLPASAVHYGSGGRWHDSVTEIFACDFRIVVCGIETEFWPHPGIPRPETIPALFGWWEEQVAALAASTGGTT